ncbi:hypothetical protein C8F04DRAFT_1180519 [Mycena alexandri]|uniref:Uncharacterized protein n=1 Tax=Mycena alexandri TaxID=1745969 RepID=A0AAD6T168_9AGAR|nr:hypothetical protein C8F04DRAFT_1180519 [Mycena alexandri]
MAAPPTTADAPPVTADIQAKAQFLVIHSVDIDSDVGENNRFDMAGIDDALKSLKKEESKEIIFVPAELVSKYKTKAAHDRETVPEDDSTSTSSSDEISVHVEGPVNESLSSSAFTAASSTQGPSTDDATAAEDLDPDVDPSPQRRSRVRFRSRVRITSGLHHYRARERERARDLHPNSHARRLSAASSTTSLSSLSSSISAPLRSPLTEENCEGAWSWTGPPKVGGRPQIWRLPATERTALLGTAHNAPPEYDYDSADDDGDSTRTLLSRQIDLVFGKWPGRLFNRQWWWWQLQPIMCCGCLDESDGGEDYT